MLNKLRAFCREQNLIRSGDTIVCAVSGGADSMALLWALYLLKEEWKLDLRAAHFNHHLRGEESDRDEQFVREFCEGYGIPLHMGSGRIVPGKKGLEAAAREARYTFLRSLPGKIATAHTADDNAETVLLHLVRGTGLKGLGGISPVSGNVIRPILMHLIRGTGLKGLGGITPVYGAIIRPMLNVTRQDVEEFLAEYCVSHIEDSSNSTDAFLRNRLRHRIMPLLKEENPRLAENLSAMALRLRLDEQALAEQASFDGALQIDRLRQMPPAVRSRALEKFLKENGVREPEAVHIRQAEALVFSENPSARADFPGGITIGRTYGILERCNAPSEMQCSFTCTEAEEILNTPHIFTVNPVGELYVRCRRSGDSIRLSGGTKSLKKLFIDRKIPAAERDQIPILCDEAGILGIPGIGVNLDRATKELPATRIQFKT